MLAWRGAGGTLFSDGDIIHQRIQSPRTIFTSEYCPGGHYSRGDIIHSDTVTRKVDITFLVMGIATEIHLCALHMINISVGFFWP